VATEIYRVEDVHNPSRTHFRLQVGLHRVVLIPSLVPHLVHVPELVLAGSEVPHMIVLPIDKNFTRQQSVLKWTRSRA
jgi:hypothetical protein